MKKFTSLMIATALVFSGSAMAKSIEPVFYLPFADDDDYETLSDWSLTCNNINTCYADGYQEGDWGDENNRLVSILLKRQAGQKELTGLAVFDFADNEGDKMKGINRLDMSVNGRAVGKVARQGDRFALSSAQINAMTDSVAKTGKAVIEFRHGKDVWRVSDAGLKEVLLKMDEQQGMTNTPYAMIKKGKGKPSTTTYQMPIVRPQSVLTAEPTYIDRGSAEGKKLIAVLKPAVAKTDETCDILDDESVEWLSDEQKQFSVTPLTGDRKLVTGNCFTGAYNMGDGAWVMDNSLSHVYQYVNYILNQEGNKLLFMMKGRGVGDCWTGAEWLWTGKEFTQTYRYDAGQCKGFGGGAWLIPSYVSEVVGEGKREFEFD